MNHETDIVGIILVIAIITIVMLGYTWSHA